MIELLLKWVHSNQNRLQLSMCYNNNLYSNCVEDTPVYLDDDFGLNYLFFGVWLGG